jgi:hypothetical protein
MTQPITPLRQRMLDDMRLRNMAAGTCRSYVHSVADYSAFHGRSPGPPARDLHPSWWRSCHHPACFDFIRSLAAALKLAEETAEQQNQHIAELALIPLILCVSPGPWRGPLTCSSA